MPDPVMSLRLREKRDADPARDYVPAWFFDIVADGRTVGEISLRIGETEHLRLYGGQVGYAIDPAHRGHGFAARAVALLLPIAREAGLDPLWITCSIDNPASRRTLEKAGATFVEIVDLPADTDMYRRGQRRSCRFRIATGG
jgi:predicted acetyltransferase